ncbi:MAG TPA: alkaline phosphatase family protein [Dyadobacter sp.]|jgi:predicted AlkP superfamily pyrophosphatase or phosphodiesterase|nr:alkaline phosphatase family protein [Dyadobacter sp.]
MRKSKVVSLLYVLFVLCVASHFANAENVSATDSVAKDKRSLDESGNARFGHKTLIIFFDGLRPDYITEDQMPRLFAFRQNAALATQHHSVFPTVTRVNSASYATGSYPGTHGILGNTVYFPKVKSDAAIGTSFGDLKKVEESESGRLLTAKSLGEVLTEAGESMMVFSSGTSGQAFLQNHKIGTGAIINPILILPESKKASVIADLGAAPEEENKNRGHQWITDALFRYGLKKDGPLVNAIWYSDPDGAAHEHGMGSPEAVASLRFVDSQFGRILDSLAARGLKEKYNIIVSSDHGFVTHTGKVGLTDFLIENKLKQNKESGDVVVAEGAIYVKGNDKDKIRMIVEMLHREDWVGAVFTKPAKKGDTNGWVKGTLSLEAIHYNHSERSGDILVAMNWNDDKNDQGYAGSGFSRGVAGHGGSSPYEINILLMASGPDFRNGFVSKLPTSNVDIAPTVLAIYDLPSPASMDGRVIGELLKKTTATSAISKKETLQTEAKYPWGNYKLSLERSVLGEYRYVDFTKVERKMR